MMGALVTAPNIARPDDIYRLLVESYAGLTDAEVGAFHARLILLLVNHIGDADAIGEAIAEARRIPPDRREP